MDLKSNLNSEFLTGLQTAEFLVVSERTLYRWHRQQKGPPKIKIGRKIYYRAEAVSQWLRDLEVVATGFKRGS